jgi:hypothetical protein
MVVTKRDTEEIKRLFGVVAEDLRSDIRQVAEGVGLLNERFDGLEGRFDGLEQKVDRMGRELTAEIRQVGTAQGDLRVKVERIESTRD